MRFLSLYTYYLAFIRYLLAMNFGCNVLRMRLLPPPIYIRLIFSKLRGFSALLICLFLYASDYVWYLMKTNLSVCASAIFVSYWQGQQEKEHTFCSSKKLNQKLKKN